MKISLQYLNDGNGNISAVQLPFSQWEKVMAKMKKYEQELMVKSDLEEAFKQVAKMRKEKGKKETLTDFLNDL